eukprot:TRINITY_DN25124_c0_g1_i1.p1 TRINITY_DN25124_c0_g1~~TRINITY_DN25124_c0_g1_i1.p1  ORF type:complete len:284 (+),score=89.80 TRINITY_DN25124_c0_g1_i1:58-909(+)
MPARAAVAAALFIAAGRCAAQRSSSWTYNEDWATYYPACGGRAQSPIDVRTDNSVAAGDSFMKLFQPREELKDMALSYGAAASAVSLDVSGRKITLTTSTLRRQYDLVRVDYHVPSEHTLDGVRYPAERQLVFKSDDEVAIMSELYTPDNSKPDHMMTHILAVEGPTRRFFPQFDFQEDEFITYHGSLTTPPCTEGVHWMVSTRRHTASVEQLQQLAEMIGQHSSSAPEGVPAQPPGLSFQIGKGNARELQVPGQRCVEESPVTDFNTLCTDPAKRKRFFGPM